MSLPTVIVCVTAAITTTIFLMLWFWAVRQKLITKKDTANIALIQLSSCYKKYMLARNGPGEDEALCILTRSRDIYHQSVTLYNHVLQKPWNYIPGFLMGFRWMSI